MPDRDVETIEHLIFYQYAKLIARSAFRMANGKQAKHQHYGFIKNTFCALKDGRKSWSEILREDRQLAEGDRTCTYCGANQQIQWEHIVPKTINVRAECANCERVQGIHNQVWVCARCNATKHTMGLYEFYRSKYSSDKKFYDQIPPIAEKKYLKTMYNCHQCAGTLNQGDLDGDGSITVLDIDFILH